METEKAESVCGTLSEKLVGGDSAEDKFNAD